MCSELSFLFHYGLLSPGMLFNQINVYRYLDTHLDQLLRLMTCWK